MLEITNFRIRSPMPLNDYLDDNPPLRVQLLMDGNVFGETPFAEGNRQSGTWDFNSTILVPQLDQMLTLVVIAKKREFEKEFTVSTINVKEMCAAEQREFVTHNDPVEFAVTCSIRSLSLFAVNAHGHHDPETNRRNAQQIRLQDLDFMGHSYHLLFDQTGDPVNINNAVSFYQQAVDATDDQDPNRLNRISNLGGALSRRFERLGSLQDLEKASSLTAQAVELTPEDHPDKPAQLHNLAGVLSREFQCRGSLPDLDGAITALRKAVKLTPEGHLATPRRLSNLGNALRTRFQHLGNLGDIGEAISSLQNAIVLSPDGNPDKPDQLNTLGSALQMLFERLGSLADIDNAILILQEAVGLTPEGHPDKPAYLSNLGSAFQTRFKRTGKPEDIEKAISSLQTALERTPENHLDEPVRLNNLGIVLATRFEHNDSRDDIDKAIVLKERALTLTPEDHQDRPGRLSNLGTTFKTRFVRFDTLADIENAISNLQKAVKLTPDGHPDKAMRLNNLGSAHSSRYERLHRPKDLEIALQTLSTAASSPIGPAMVRFQAARSWARMAAEHSRSPLVAFRCAINLLPQIAWLGLKVTDQHALLADVGDIVRDAVAAAIQLEEYETAVEWAEQGRSIVWQNLLNLRTPIDDLRATDSQLADQLQIIAHQLEASISDDLILDKAQQAPTVDVSRKYLELATEWESKVEEIRRLPDFESFLKPKSFSKLAPAAHEGPVVILNSQSSRCDAVVLISDDSKDRRVSVINIPLKNFSYEKSKELVRDLTSLLSSERMRARKSGRLETPINAKAKFDTILHTLWLDVVKPVIDGLAYEVQLDNPPRIWWCATAFLSFLPIHAAGLYETEEMGEKLSDYVISSYTPTLGAIIDSSKPLVREDFRVLTVAQPSTPYATPIPKTDEEVEIIQRLANGVQIVSLTKENATVERVLQGMVKSDWIHLACHGQQGINDAMKSGFLLHDRILELSEIVKLSLPKADFAFLSACQTATGDERVAEESVHLAAGMLLSGCRGVIATMWSIRDDDGPIIVEGVYGQILKDGKPSRKEAAHALHSAVKQLRESGAGFLCWVPFIHIGR